MTNQVDLSSVLDAALKGDAAALNQLMELVRPTVRHWGAGAMTPVLRKRIDSSDIAQEVLEGATAGFRDFRGTTPAEFMAWLRRILEFEARRLHNHHAALKRDANRDCQLDGQPPGRDATPSQEAMRNEQDARRQQALLTLGEDDRQVIHLKEYQAVSIKEIATRMGRSEDAVRKLHARALIRWRNATENLP